MTGNRFRFLQKCQQGLQYFSSDLYMMIVYAYVGERNWFLSQSIFGHLKFCDYLNKDLRSEREYNRSIRTASFTLFFLFPQWFDRSILNKGRLFIFLELMYEVYKIMFKIVNANDLSDKTLSLHRLVKHARNGTCTHFVFSSLPCKFHLSIL